MWLFMTMYGGLLTLLHSHTCCANTDATDATVPRPSLHSNISLDDTVSVDSSERLLTEQVATETGRDDEMEEDTDSVFQLIPEGSTNTCKSDLNVRSVFV